MGYMNKQIYQIPKSIFAIELEIQMYMVCVRYMSLVSIVLLAQIAAWHCAPKSAEFCELCKQLYVK